MKIALIDDKTNGIEQIKSRHKKEDFTLYYFDTFQSFDEYPRSFDIIYLDYFLDKDGLTGADVLKRVQKKTENVIGFSSVEKYSKLLYEKGANQYIIKK